MFFDSHAHLDDGRFEQDREEIIRSLPKSGISYVVNAGSSMESSRESVGLANSYDFIYAAVGVHPHEAETMTADDLRELEEMSRNSKVVAIGEIGLDYYYDNSPRELQRQRFKDQIELAHRLELPIIIHDRDAHGDVLNILRDRRGRLCGGVMHCYSGSWEMAKLFLDLGLYISLGGVVTFKNAQKAIEVVKNIGPESLLIETDCPYLTPVPHRGKRNYPGYVSLVAERIAEIRGMRVEEVAEVTTQNAMKLFGIKSKV